jgi:hypothetical protein
MKYALSQIGETYMTDTRRNEQENAPSKDDQMDEVRAPRRSEEVELPAAPGTTDNR